MQTTLGPEIDITSTTPTETAAESLMKMGLGVAYLVETAYISAQYTSKCENEWLTAVFKALGLQLVGLILLSALTWPLRYWHTSQRRRGKRATTAKTVANFLNPLQRTSGRVAHLLIVFALFKLFTRGCR